MQSLPLLLLFITTTTIISTAAALTATSDVSALAAFKSSISPSSITPWSCLASWNFSSDPCHPTTPTHFTCGLSCSSSTTTTTTRITAITLDPAGYSGTLPSALSNLTLLAHLHLFSNSFHGSIPPSLSSLTSLLTLDLSSNSLSGPLPPSLASLTSLTTLSLARNALTGPIPSSLSAMASLFTLDLSFNSLSGPLPASLPPNLVNLALKANSISGTLKRSTFGRLRRLEVAELAANRLQGRVEAWFLQLPALQQVDLANNSIAGVDAVAAGGDAGGESLVALDLGFNRIEGELPARLAAAFPSLVAVSVRHNRLLGTIPAGYGAAFRRLYLDGNFLKGRVPPELMGADVKGSVGDNCLVGCPATAALCSPGMKPEWVCRQAYGADEERQ